MTTESVLVAAAIVAFAASGCWLAITDLRTKRLPNRHVTLTGASVLVLLTVASVVAGTWTSWVRCLVAAVLLAGAYFVLAVISAGGVGMGDVKFAAVVGMVCGWHSWNAVIIGTGATILLAAAVGVGLLVTRRANRRSVLPFGPFMVVGALLALVVA